MDLNSLRYLYDVKLKRDPLESKLVWGSYLGSLFVAWLFGLATGRPDAVLIVFALCTGLVLPLVRALSDVSLVQSLIAGGCLEEIRQTRLKAQEMVDTLVQCSVRRQLTTLRLAGPLALLWCLVQYPGVTGLFYSLVWFVSLVALTVAVAYFGLAQVAKRYSRGNPLDGFSSWAYMIAIGVPLTTLIALFDQSVVNEGTANLGTLPGWPLYLIPALLAGTVAAREVAVAGLKNAERAFRPNSAGLLGVSRHQRIAQLKPWSDNPIVARECSRELGTLQAGWLGYVTHRWGLGLIFGLSWLVIFWELNLLGMSSYTGSWTLTLLSILLACRAGGRIQGALADERDKKTLEILVVSRLNSAEFVDGWAQVGYVPRVREMILAASLQIVSCLAFYRSPQMALSFAGAALSGYFLIRGAAYFQLGLGMRSCSKKRDIWDTVQALQGVLGTVLVLCILPYNEYLFEAALVAWALYLQRSGRAMAVGTLG